LGNEFPNTFPDHHFLMIDFSNFDDSNFQFCKAKFRKSEILKKTSQALRLAYIWPAIFQKRQNATSQATNSQFRRTPGRRQGDARNQQAISKTLNVRSTSLITKS